MATQKQRSETTKAALLKAFRAALLKRGIDHTTTQYVLTQTGLSKGAMYHHFRSKAEIVEALYEDEARQAIARAMKSVAKDTSPLTQLKAACLAWMDEVRNPSVSKILFEIGPSALGPQRAKEIEDAISRKLINDLLEQAITAGDIKRQDPKLTAAFLNALVTEASLYTLRNGHDATQQLSDAIDGLFKALQA